MASVDERIVRMVFDNAKFESAIQTTLKTLDKLKSALNMDKAGADFEKLEQASKKVDFAHMSNALDQIANRFSTFGIIGMTVLQNLTTAAMNAAKNIANALTSAITSGGKKRALNIEQAKFQIQGLGYTWEQVEADINYGVKDTAYGLDSAAKAASQLLASNVKVGDSMKAALRGISGVAAMTSSEYDDIAKVFTTVAGNGRLMGDQLNQLSARGLNVAATLGKALGKSEQEIREMVSKGKIDFATFSKAMDDAFGEHAKKANDTFTGALSNMKAALSRIGAAFATPAYTNLRLAINALTPVIDDVKKALGPLIDTATKAMEIASKLAVEILGGLNIAEKLAWPMEAINKILLNFGRILGELPSAMSPATEAIRGAFGSLYDLIKSLDLDSILQSQFEIAISVSKAFASAISHFVNVSSKALYVFGQFLTTIPGAIEPVFKAVKMVFKNIFNMVSSFSLDDALNKMLDGATRIVVAFGNTVSNLIRIAYQLVLPVIQAFQDSFSSVFGRNIIDILVDIAEAIENFTSRIKMNARFYDNLKKTFTGLFTLIGAIADILLDVAYIVGPILSSAVIKGFGFFIDVCVKIYAVIGDLIVGVKDFINEIKSLKTVRKIVEKISDIFDTVKSAIGSAVDTTHDFTNLLLDKTFETFAFILGKIAEAVLFVAHAIDDTIVKVGRFIKRLSELPGVQKVLQRTSDSFDALRTKVSNVSSILVKKLGPAFTNTREFMSKVISKIRELIDKYVELPSTQEAVERFVEFVNDVFEKSNNIFDVGKNLVKEFVDRVKELGSTSFGKVIDNLGELKNRISETVDVAGRLKSIGDFFISFRDGISSFSNDTGSFLGTIKDKIAEFFEWVRSKVSSISLGDIIAAGAGGSLIAFMFSFTKFLSAATSLTKKAEGFLGAIMGLPKALGGVLNEIAGLMKSKATEIKMEAISGIIKSIALLAGAIAVLATMDQEKVRESAITIGVLGAALVVISGVMTKIAGVATPDAVAKSSGMMIAIAGAMFVMVLALKVLAKVDMDGIATRLIVLGVLMAELAAFVIAVNRLAPNLTTGSVAIISISISLLMLTRAFSNLSSLSTDSVLVGSVILGALIGMLAILSKISEKSSQTLTAVAGIVAIAIALNLMVRAIGQLGSMDEKTLTAGISGIIDVVAAMGVLILATKFAGQYAVQAGGAMILMGVALHVITAVIEKMAAISETDINKAEGVIGEILILFGILTLMTKFAGKNAQKAGAAIIMMSGALILVAGAMAIMAKIDPAGLTRATIAISAIIAMFSLLVASTKFVKKAQKTITTMTICVAALGGVLAVLSLLEPDNLKSATEAITVVMGMFALLLVATKTAGKVNATIFVMVAVVGVLSGILYGLAQLPTGSALSAALALSTVLLSFSAALFIVQNIPISALQGVGALIGMITIFGVFLGAIGALNTYVPEIQTFLENGIPILEAIGKGLGSFVGGIVEGLLESASNSLPTIGSNFTAFMENLSGFIDGAKSIDDSALAGIDVVVSMLTALSTYDFLDAITWWSDSGSFIEGVTENLPALTEAVKSFANEAKNIDQSSLDAASIIVGILSTFDKELKIGPGGFLLWFGTNYEAIANALPSIAKAFYDYSWNVRGMDTGSVNNTKNACTIIVELAKSLPQVGGLKTAFTGDNAMSLWSTQLPLFATALHQYADNISGMNTDAVTSTQEASQIITELATSATKVKVTKNMDGTSSFGRFISALPVLGQSLHDYASNIAGMDTQSVKNTKYSSEIIMEIASSVDGIDELNASFDGKNSMTRFADSLPTLAKGLHDYASNIAGMDTQSVKNTKYSSEIIMEIASIAPGIDLLDASLNGDNPMKRLAESLPTFAQSLHDYSWNIRGMDTGSVNNTRNASSIILDLASTVADVDIETNWDGSSSFGRFIGGLPTLGQCLHDYAANISGMETSAVTDTKDAAKTVLDIASTISNMDQLGVGTINSGYLTEIGDNFRSFSESVSTIKSEEVDSAKESMEKIVETVETLGSTDLTSAEQICDGLKNIVDKITTNFVEPLAKIPDEAYNSASKISAQLGLGFTSGISSTMTDFYNGGKSLMTKLAEGLRGGKSGVNLEVTSICNGAVTTIGFSSGKFKTAGSGIVKNIVSGINNTKKTISDTISSAINQASAAASTKLLTFISVGKKINTNISAGVRSGVSTIRSAIQYVMSNASSNISVSNFYSVGKNAMRGIANGTNDNAYLVERAAKNAALQALKSAKEALGIHSPSREFYKTGRWAMLGMANGIAENAKYAERSSTEAASDILESTNKILDGIDMTADLNYSPVITPVVDMTNIEQTAGYMKRVFGEYPLATGPIGDLANVSSRIETAQYEKILSKLDKLIDINQNESGPRTFEFTQINNSPTALSNSEIYRQTKSQFARFKDKVGK